MLVRITRRSACTTAGSFVALLSIVACPARSLTKLFQILCLLLQAEAGAKTSSEASRAARQTFSEAGQPWSRHQAHAAQGKNITENAQMYAAPIHGFHWARLLLSHT